MSLKKYQKINTSEICAQIKLYKCILWSNSKVLNLQQ